MRHSSYASMKQNSAGTHVFSACFRVAGGTSASAVSDAAPIATLASGRVNAAAADAANKGSDHLGPSRTKRAAAKSAAVRRNAKGAVSMPDTACIAVRGMEAYAATAAAPANAREPFPLDSVNAHTNTSADVATVSVMPSAFATSTASA